jgi:hypothetical protein
MVSGHGDPQRIDLALGGGQALGGQRPQVRHCRITVRERQLGR